MPLAQAIEAGWTEAAQGVEGAAPCLIGFAGRMLPYDVGFIEQGGVVTNEFLQIAYRVNLSVGGSECPLFGGDVAAGGLELGILEGGCAPLGFALSVDALEIFADTRRAFHTLDATGLKQLWVLGAPLVETRDGSRWFRSWGNRAPREKVC